MAGMHGYKRGGGGGGGEGTLARLCLVTYRAVNFKDYAVSLSMAVFGHCVFRCP